MAHDIVPAGGFHPIRAASETPSHETFEQLTYVLFKRWRLILGCLIAFLGAAALATLSQRPVYKAEAKILLKPDRMSLQISELSPHSARSPYSSQALQSEIELIRSRDVLRPVATKLVAEDLSPGEEAPEAAIDAATRRLSRRVRATAVQDASVIEIGYADRSEEEATRVLDMVVNQYLEHHAVAYGGSAQLLEFYETEKKEAAEGLAAAEDALHRWQEENDVVAIDPRIAGLLQQQSQLEQRLKETKAATVTTLQLNPLLARLKGDQMTAEIELNTLLQRYTQNDRRVQEKKRSVALLRSQKVNVERSVLSSLEAEQASLESQIGETEAALAALREKKLTGTRLTRALDVAQEAFLLYGRKLEEARISSNLDRAQLSNVAIIEQAHSTGTTDANERSGFMILAAMVGLTLGLVAAFGFEFFNRALRTRRDVEVYLGVPVLAAIPDLRTRAIADLRHEATA